MPFLERDDTRIYYEYVPSAKVEADTLVLLHGLGLDLTTMQPLVPVFTEHYHVLLYDVRGHGQSEAGDVPLTWDILCDDLFALTRVLDISRLMLVGYGLGGYIATQYTLLQPEQVQALLFLSTPFLYPVTIGERVVGYRERLAQNGSLLSLAEQMVPYLIHPVTEAKKQVMMDAYAKASTDCYFRLLKLIVDGPWLTLLTRVEAPTLFLAGERDPVYAPNVIGISASYLPDSRFLIIPNASNAVMLDKPAMVANWFYDFINTWKEKQEMPSGACLFQSIPLQIGSDLSSHLRQMIDYGKERLDSAHALEVEMLDAFRVRLGGEEILEGWNQRYAKRLLVYLLIHSSVTREELCDTFWPNVELTKARNNLRVSLNHLKKLLEQSNDRFLVIDREQVQLQGMIKCDFTDLVKEMRKVTLEADPIRKRFLCQSILERVPDTFLPGLYDNWALDLREWLEAQVTVVCKWLIPHLEERREFALVSKYQKILRKFSRNNETYFDQ